MTVPHSKLSRQPNDFPKRKHADKRIPLSRTPAHALRPSGHLAWSHSSQGGYQDKPKLPFIPGSEVSGVVTEVASGVKSLRVGDKVRAQCYVDVWATVARSAGVSARRGYLARPWRS